MSFLDAVDLIFLEDIDLVAFQRELDVDDVVIDLMNYIKNVDYCDAIRQQSM